jgi:translation initiation factor 1
VFRLCGLSAKSRTLAISNTIKTPKRSRNTQFIKDLLTRVVKNAYLMAVICKKCGLPDDLCACGELDKEDARIVVRLETRRFSKSSTIIEGINPKQSDMPRIVKELKSTFACGGTMKNGFIMLQGDHRDEVKGILSRLGLISTPLSFSNNGICRTVASLHFTRRHLNRPV